MFQQTTQTIYPSTADWENASKVYNLSSSNPKFEHVPVPVPSSTQIPAISWDDATWILTSSFIIFTMQSGFGLLEAGNVSGKNEVNIMVKNAVDVVFGGLSYWMFGYGLSFGEGPHTNAFVGVGHFFVDSNSTEHMGVVYSNFIFQLSFATTATTIVSGAMAERTKLTSYILFSFCNTVVYSIPAHWVWAKGGYLKELGVVDIAGSGAVHLVGGVSGLVATIMLKPRIGRFESHPGVYQPPMGNATNAIVGMFMLWWGWLGFNCGSTFGISNGKWKLAAKSAVTTLNASMGGGAAGILLSYILHSRKLDVGDLVNSILGALVSITAGCAVVRPWESILVGAVGGVLAILCVMLLNKLRVDDPVGAIAVHGMCGIWGLLAVGLLVEPEPVEKLHNNQLGLVKGGGFYSLGVQTLAAVSIIAWSAVTTWLILMVIQLTVGLRMSAEDEILGADIVEHGITSELMPIPHTNNGTPSIAIRRSSLGMRRAVFLPEYNDIEPLDALRETSETDGDPHQRQGINNDVFTVSNELSGGSMENGNSETNARKNKRL